MKRLILLEWQKIKWPVLGTLFAGIVASIILCSTLYKAYALSSQLEVWEIGMGIINFVFPLIAVLPTGWLMYYERKNNFLIYTLPRVSKKDYILAKWIVVAGSAFVTMFAIAFAGVLTALVIIPQIQVMETVIDTVSGQYRTTLTDSHVLGSLFETNALKYGFLLSLWKGVLAALMASMGFIFSLYIKNLFIIMTGPFLYYMLENFTLAVLQIPQYRLVTSFEPTSLSASSISTLSMLTGPGLAILFIVIFVFYFAKLKKVTIYPS